MDNLIPILRGQYHLAHQISLKQSINSYRLQRFEQKEYLLYESRLWGKYTLLLHSTNENNQHYPTKKKTSLYCYCYFHTIYVSEY